MAKKTCSRCGRSLPATTRYFYSHPEHSDNLDGRCKTCHLAGSRKEYRQKRTKVLARQKIYERNHAQEIAARKRRHLIVKHYGLTLEEYSAILVEQKGVCAICGRPETQIARGSLASLSIDHDHTTGEVRGLLCHTCNLALGNMQDNPQWLRRAAKYLEQNRRPRSCFT